MNSNQIRTNRMVVDWWPILVAFAMYLLAFGIFVDVDALSRNSGGVRAEAEQAIDSCQA